jgi:cobalamin biosynthesis Mg chelatase CobN
MPKCPECGKEFRTEKGLQIHMEEKHPKKTEKVEDKKKISSVQNNENSNKKNEAKSVSKSENTSQKEKEPDKKKEVVENKKSSSRRNVKKHHKTKSSKIEKTPVFKESKSKKEDEAKSSSFMLYLILGLIVLIIVLLIIFVPKLNANKPVDGDSQTNGSDVFDEPVVLATINGEEITQDSLAEVYSVIPVQQRTTVDEKEILEEYIKLRLLSDYANKQGLSVTDEEINEVLAEVYNYSDMTEQEYKDFLKVMDIDFDSFKNNYVRKSLLINKLHDLVILPNIQFTEDELRQYYNDNKEMLSVYAQGSTFEDLREQVESTLTIIRMEELSNELLLKLKNDANIKYFVEINNIVACLNKYNVGKNIIYYTANNCDSCQEIEQKLIDEGVDYYKAVVSEDSEKIVKECFSEMYSRLEGVVPITFCKTGNFKIGRMTNDELKQFVASCK